MLPRSEKCDFHPKGSSNEPFFFSFSCVNVLEISYCVSSRVKSKTIHKQIILSNKRHRVLWKMTSVEIERLVLRSGSWRGWYLADKCLPAARSRCSFEMKTARSDQRSGICTPASKSASSLLSRVTRAPDETPEKFRCFPVSGTHARTNPPEVVQPFRWSTKATPLKKVAFMSTKAIIKDTLISFIPF